MLPRHPPSVIGLVRSRKAARPGSAGARWTDVAGPPLNAWQAARRQRRLISLLRQLKPSRKARAPWRRIVLIRQGWPRAQTQRSGATKPSAGRESATPVNSMASSNALDPASKAYDGDLQMIDASSVRVHQHAACARKGWRIWCHASPARRLDEQDPRAGGCRGQAHGAQDHTRSR